MTLQDTNKILELLSILSPRGKKVIDKKFAAAWLLALQPFDYGTVRAAALEYSRKKSFFPEVSELIKIMRSCGRGPSEKRSVAWKNFLAF